MKIEHRAMRYYIQTKTKLGTTGINYLRSSVKDKLLVGRDYFQRFVLTSALQILQVVSIVVLRTLLFFFLFFLKLLKYLTPFKVTGVTSVNPTHVLFRL